MNKATLKHKQFNFYHQLELVFLDNQDVGNPFLLGVFNMKQFERYTGVIPFSDFNTYYKQFKRNSLFHR